MKRNIFGRTQLFLPLIVALALSVLGCEQPGVSVEYVRGVVTLDGTPLEGATVFFSPKGGEGIGASGMTQGDGSFALNTQGAKPGAGAAVGDYAVSISKTEMPEFPDISEDDPRYGTPEHDRLQQQASRAKPKVIVPQKYNAPETTPFSAQVVLGNNDFTFEVSSKVD